MPSSPPSPGPIEAEKRIADAIQDSRPLNEVKLLLVGRGMAGKTSVRDRLLYSRFDPLQQETSGIDIRSWRLPCDDQFINVHVWDFAGQQIVHAAHQFFLTERSIYLLVLNARADTQQADAEYWLRNLTAGSDLESPLPVPGSEIGLAHFTALDVAYDSFQSGVGAKPFHELNGKKDTTPSITSFLCTDLAYKIYASASSELTAYHGGQKKLQHASALPLDRKGNPVTTGLTNEQVLAEAYHFFNYATKKGRRATPHQA